MIQTIQKNAELIRRLHSKIDETFEVRSKSKEQWKEWEQACSEFHSRYDQLAFPGGLEQGIERIKEGHLPTIQTALTYLENTPYCFRSQYVAKDLKRALNKVELPDRLAEQFNTYKLSKRPNKTG